MRTLRSIFIVGLCSLSLACGEKDDSSDPATGTAAPTDGASPFNTGTAPSGNAAAMPGAPTSDGQQAQTMASGFTPSEPGSSESGGSTPSMDGNMGGSGAGSSGPPDACDGLCLYMEMCGQCFYDPEGNCLDQAGCGAVCRQDTPPVVAICVAGLTECDTDAFEGCYDNNIGDDDCAQTCRRLEECEECFTDENGDCLTLAGCALVCRDTTPPAAATCIAGLQGCEGIDACFMAGGTL